MQRKVASIPYDPGLYVWRHMVRDCGLFCRKVAYQRAMFKKNTLCNVGAKVSRMKDGVKAMMGRRIGCEFGCIDNDFRETFHAGISGRERQNQFSGFKIT